MATRNSEPVDPIYQEIGRRIRDLRMRSNGRSLNQEELAESVSLSRASIANIERGRQKVFAHTLVQIATALDVPPWELLPAWQPKSDEWPDDLTDEATRNWIDRGRFMAST